MARFVSNLSLFYLKKIFLSICFAADHDVDIYLL